MNPKSLKYFARGLVILAACLLMILTRSSWVWATPYGGSSYGVCAYERQVLGDLNNDCHVNILDVAIMVANYNKAGIGIRGDLNHDNVVNIFDVSIMISNYGK